MKRRVVLTGMGVISPLGLTVPETWSGLLEGRSGIGPITKFDPTEIPTKIAGEVRGFDPAAYVDRKEIKRSDPFVWFSLAAAKEAMAQAGFGSEAPEPDRFGVIIGSGIGGVQTWEAQHETLLSRGPGRVSPFFVPMMITNMAAGMVSLAYNLRGPSFCTTSACASGAHAIGEAFHAIRDGKADLMLAGGSEASITLLSIAGFCSLKALSTRNEVPEEASRPFDKGRDGFVLSEGAALVVLEELEHARARGASVICEVVGYGCTADAHHMTAPDPNGEGAMRAMKAALDDGQTPRDEVVYVNAHGTSTPLNDRFETLAIRRLFGAHADELAVSSTKSMTGHLLGAAGSLEFVISALAIQRSAIPPTINYRERDPECDLDYVPNTAREAPVDTALTNSLGFGGHNVSLVLRKF
jgi:3-oxoacyl-[acyl-carrier-protein] synthase II